MVTEAGTKKRYNGTLMDELNEDHRLMVRGTITRSDHHEHEFPDLFPGFNVSTFPVPVYDDRSWEKVYVAQHENGGSVVFCRAHHESGNIGYHEVYLIGDPPDGFVSAFLRTYLGTAIPA